MVVISIFMLAENKIDLESKKEVAFMNIFTNFLFIFMILVGLIDVLIFKKWDSVAFLILGIVLLIVNIRLTKKMRKAKHKY